MKLHEFATVDEVVGALADYFVDTTQAAIAAHGRCSVALSGGSSPKKLYELLASDAYRARIDWPKLDFFFGDERYVPHTDPDSNYLMAKKALFEPLQIADSQVFAIDTSGSPQEAADQYTATLQQYFGARDWRFDLVLLGLGDNSHTASLFPHTPVLTTEAVGAASVFLEDQQVFRITLTAPLLNKSDATAFLVYGQGKALAVRHVLEDAQDTLEYPAQLVAPPAGTDWFLDKAAASELQNK